MDEYIIPLALRDTAPMPGDWLRLTGIRPDGLSDGFHTGAACDCLERALAWEQIVRAGPARPGGYRRTAERLDAWYN